MAKRKRSSQHDKPRPSPAAARASAFEAHLSNSRKLLARALKTAKGFERQKLGKRRKLAESGASRPTKGNGGNAVDGSGAVASSSEATIARLDAEIAALKTLDLGKAGDAHLRKTLLRGRDGAQMVAAELLACLPEEPRLEGSEEERRAVHNVTSLLYNAKVVRECVQGIVKGARSILGEAETVRGGIDKPGNDRRVERPLEGKNKDGHNDEKETKESDEEWRGFSSDGDEKINGGQSEIDGDAGSMDGVELDDDDFDSDTWAQYDARIADSEDEDDDEDDVQLNYTSSSVSPSRTPSPSLSLSPSPPPAARIAQKSSTNKSTKSKSQNQPPLRGSTFLPTLMGGYYSGSESASDIDEPSSGTKSKKDVQQKKNRPGQQARRQIWEKKYGSRANHVREGGNAGARGGSSGGERPRGGARGGRGGYHRGASLADARAGSGHREIYGFDESAARPQAAVNGQSIKGANDRKGMGVDHPSWLAAKKAKEMKQTATFQGRKVTFD